jgi:hypothetical protein
MEMSINYLEEQAAQAEKEAKAKHDRLNAEGWGQVLSKFPLRDTQANFTVLCEWCAPNTITVEAFESLLRSNSKSLDMTSREGIIKDILDHSTGDKNTLRDLGIRLSTWSLGQLRQKRSDIAFKQGIHTKDDAKQYLAGQRDKEIGWRNTGYPKLASTYVPPGQVQAVPTGQYLRELSKTDLRQFKHAAIKFQQYQGEQYVDTRTDESYV